MSRIIRYSGGSRKAYAAKLDKKFCVRYHEDSKYVAYEWVGNLRIACNHARSYAAGNSLPDTAILLKPALQEGVIQSEVIEAETPNV